MAGDDKYREGESPLSIGKRIPKEEVGHVLFYQEEDSPGDYGVSIKMKNTEILGNESLREKY